MVKNIRCKARRYKEWSGREGMEYTHRHVDLAPLGLGTVPLGTVFDIPVTGMKNGTFPRVGGSLLQL